MVERLLLAPLAGLGRYGLLLFAAFRSPGSPGSQLRNLVDQMMRLGIESIPIVALAAAFSGAVTTVQTAYQLVSPLVPRETIGGIVAPSIILELATLIPGFVLAGRVGARIAAELGTMRVTEQIDALEAMGLDSKSYLILPRVLAGSLMFPVLYVAASFVGIVGGILAGTAGGYLTPEEFVEGARGFFQPFSAVFGVIKAAVFGFVITSVSCYYGYRCGGGASGVGVSTTRAVVVSCVFMLLADLVLAIIFL